jgi:hypothetical protein
MSKTDTGPAARGADRFDTAATLLARYPELDASELADLKHWYRKEASAYDVASMASRDDVRPGYRAFRAEHVDRFTGADVAKGALFALAMAGIAYAIVAPGLS